MKHVWIISVHDDTDVLNSEQVMGVKKDEESALEAVKDVLPPEEMVVRKSVDKKGEEHAWVCSVYNNIEHRTVRVKKYEVT
jgi:hypothetical protein